MPWSQFCECWVSSQHYHSPLSPSKRGSLVPLHYLSFGGVICYLRFLIFLPRASSLWFIHPSISHDVLCFEAKQAGWQYKATYSSYIPKKNYVPFSSSVQFSHSVLSDSLRPHGLKHTRLPWPSPTPWAYPNSCPLTPWFHPTVSSSVIFLPSLLQSFPASGSIPMSQFITSGGQRTGVSLSASVLPMNIQDWFPLGWTGWISLQSRRLLRVFSNTTVQKH